VIADLKYRAKGGVLAEPEPTAYWNSGDSIVSQYAPYCEKVIELSHAAQLDVFVGEPREGRRRTSAFPRRAFVNCGPKPTDALDVDSVR